MKPKVMVKCKEKNNFEIQIVFPRTNTGLPEDIYWFIKNVELPKESNEVLELKRGNSVLKFPGSASFQAGTITIYDGITNDIEKVLVDWRRKVYNSENDKIGFAANFKAVMNITLYAPDGSSGSSSANDRAWVFEGLWPSEIIYGSLDYSDSGFREIGVTLSYDRAYRKK